MRCEEWSVSSQNKNPTLRMWEKSKKSGADDGKRFLSDGRSRLGAIARIGGRSRREEALGCA